MNIATHAIVGRSACVALLAVALSCDAQEVRVRVERRGDAIVIDVDATVAASSSDAWAVFTDYDHMASFLSNLKSSSVVSRHGNSLEVSQSGETRVGFLRFSFGVVRAVELRPLHEIHSRLVQGDFKSYDATTRIVDRPPLVRIIHHGEYVPKAWLPPMIGPAIVESETKKQYQEFIAEILRRKAVSPTRD